MDDNLSKILSILGFNSVDSELVKIIQAIIFSSESPVTLKKLDDLLEEYDLESIESSLTALFSLHDHLGIKLNRISGGYLFTTSEKTAPWIRKYLGARSTRLSQASLETLSIVAYLQPVTQLQINEIRGVTSDSSIKLLVEKGLIKSVGRKNEPGRPILYSTTRDFLTFFDIDSLSSLPLLETKEEDESITNENESLSLMRDLIVSSTPQIDKNNDELQNSFNNLEKHYDAIENMELKLMTAMGLNTDEQTVGKEHIENISKINEEIDKISKLDDEMVDKNNRED